MSDSTLQMDETPVRTQGPPLPQDGDANRALARLLIDRHMRTNPYPYTRHHIQSYDQFITKDLQAIIRAENPIIILKDLIDTRRGTGAAAAAVASEMPDPDTTDNDTPEANRYTYKAEIFIGGPDATEIMVGTPTVSLQKTKEVRALFPNECRLRNLTYATTVFANIYVKLTYTRYEDGEFKPAEFTHKFERYPLFRLPVMLHSSLCLLNGKSKEFVREAGECPNDHGGYFIVAGSEKVLVTRQEQAFNTLYVSAKSRTASPNASIIATLSSLSPTTRIVKRVGFYMLRRTGEIVVSIPFVRKEIPLFVLFRALGIVSDEEIYNTIFPDPTGAEAQLLGNLLTPSMVAAGPFYNTYTALQYIKSNTKGFGDAHVLDILHNQLFIHVDDQPKARAIYLGDCVRSILRVAAKVDKPTDRDDTRNQRCLASGFHIQMLFAGIYKQWVKAINYEISKQYNYNKALYQGPAFMNIFRTEMANQIFKAGFMTESIMRAFKGKWGSGLGEEKAGILQELSRMSYLDFMSHCRRVVLEFDTGLKLTGPRHLHPSQFGYFCTSETPGGASIGIAKNLTVMTYISTSTTPAPLIAWLRERVGIRMPADVSADERVSMTPVYVNSGIVGYTNIPQRITRLLKLLKHTGWLPPTTSVSFAIRDKRVQVYLDAGRPVRPLIILKAVNAPAGANLGAAVLAARMPRERLIGLPTWRDLIMGTHPARRAVDLSVSEFEDPLAGVENGETTVEQRIELYEKELAPHVAPLEYVDPYEHNETYIATFPEHIVPETTHVELHPSTMLSIVNSQIPFANHNQSPRNQLGCAQSKQSLSMYATNWKNRFDNTAHVLCYGEAPLCRTIYQEYFGEGRAPYGQNIMLALGCYTGYNQEDGIVFNKDAIDRGLFRSMAFRTYEIYEEDDEMTKMKTRFGNPANIPAWMDLRPGQDYSNLDDRGIIKPGSFVDESTVIVGAYMQNQKGEYKDASIAPQVWTRGRVDEVVVTVNNMGLRQVKIRVCHDRKPELGDKFCLTPDHEVLTSHGWKSIRRVTAEDFVAVLAEDGQTVKFSMPTDFPEFDHPGGHVYTVKTAATTLTVTRNHRLYARTPNAEIYSNYECIVADDLYEEFQKGTVFVMRGADNCDYEITAMTPGVINPKYKTVHCLTTETGNFLVRRKGTAVGVWTGNSNRHGQKGTIGMFVPALDMPRTASGLVPDIIVNPHSIPSRMTMGQLMEQISAKLGVKVGSLADGTTFMAEGSPADTVGAQLEALGFERYGNEIMYNGMTGQQIPTDIFIAPIYGMRLKHMVEDKWQAREKGRKEQRTHQPTGGRGAQGGLKLGEQERDGIVCHGTSSFMRESFMDRSDGEIFPVCTGCGTIPIYNPKLGLEICTLCDGPVEFAGTTANTLEIVPPLKKPTGQIVRVELPYSTKLLMQEVTTFLNAGMRIVTTAGVKKIATPINEFSEMTPAGPQETLKPRVLPEAYVAPIQAPVEAPPIEQLEAMAKSAGMVLVPEAAANLQELRDAAANAVAAAEAATTAAVEGELEEAAPEAPIMTEAVPGVPQLEPGAAAPGPTALPAAVPAAGPVISIDTDDAAMAVDGLTMPAGINDDLPPPPPVAGPGAAAPRNTARRTLRGNAAGPVAAAAEPAPAPVNVKIVKLGADGQN